MSEDKRLRVLKDILTCELPLEKVEQTFEGDEYTLHIWWRKGKRQFGMSTTESVWKRLNIDYPDRRHSKQINLIPVAMQIYQIMLVRLLTQKGVNQKMQNPLVAPDIVWPNWQSGREESEEESSE